MPRKSLVWKLFPVYFLIMLAIVLVLNVYDNYVLENINYQYLQNDLKSRASIINSSILEPANPLSDSNVLNKMIKHIDKTSNTRVTITNLKGDVIADSRYNSKKMQNHLNRPEISLATRGKIGSSRRYSRTLDFSMIYLAMPIVKNSHRIGVIRVSVPAYILDKQTLRMERRFYLGTIIVALLAGLASVLAARIIISPIRIMQKVAARFASGNFKARVPHADTLEFSELAETLNKMADQLDLQMRTITNKSSEQDAILSSMREGVVAIDTDDRILILNPMAEKLLNVNQRDVIGKTIQETIRNPKLIRFFHKSREAGVPYQEEFVFYAPEPTTVQATGSILVDVDCKELGELVVLNDITKTKSLENMRRDFVANVSHELRTPITSIKGFVETLRDHSDTITQEKSSEFLDIINRQADRLNLIIEDLLALSRIEQDKDYVTLDIKESDISQIIKAAVSNCIIKASENNVEVIIADSDKISAQVNAPLIEQAVTNLVDNAIKFTPGGTINIEAKLDDNNVEIKVVDNGCGIDVEHLPRVFERFYRVDKARSRKMGGTGLGLAIVKHIAQAHNGNVAVESTIGKGSTFTITLPLKQTVINKNLGE